MQHRRIAGSRWLALLAVAPRLPIIASAAPPTAPLVLTFPETMQSGRGGAPNTMGLVGGLVGNWVNAAQDKHSAKQIVAFRDETAGLDFIDAVRESLKCLGVPEPRTTCRELLTLPDAKDVKELAAQLGEKGITDFVTVDIVPLLSDERFQVRAYVTESTVTPKGVQSNVSYTAVYNSRSPKDLVDAGNPDALKAYWREGEPSRVRREALAAAQEIERTLSFLREKLGGQAETRPAFAKELPKIKELQANGRVRCGGTACGDVRVVRDSGPRLWLTTIRVYGAYGPVIVSLDENTAKFQANILTLMVAL